MTHVTAKMVIAIVCCLFWSIWRVAPCLPDEGSSDVSKEYVVGPDDVIDIQVWGNDDMRRIVEISRDGTFTFPFIDKVSAAGLSIAELESLITHKLSDGYFTNPQVTITVSKYRSQRVIVLGEVNRPGSYPVKGKTHILEIISEAGGLTDKAGRTITVTRSDRPRGDASDGESRRVDTSISIELDQLVRRNDDAQFFVHNGDSIYVAQARRIFVTGEVNRPGEYRWERGLTVNQAISLAGGATKRGAPERTKITRTEKGAEIRIKPKLSDAVVPDDIIEVPQSYF